MVKGREKVVLELCQYIESIVSSKKKKKKTGICYKQQQILFLTFLLKNVYGNNWDFTIIRLCDQEIKENTLFQGQAL